jgi:hypothetical protein
MMRPLVLALGLGLLVACSPAQTAVPPPSSTGAIVPTMTVSDALARQLELDGDRIRVLGTYWSDGQAAFLADVLLKSFPPQVDRASAILLQGPVPADVLARLEHAPAGLAPITWGPVEVVGILHAERGPAAARLEILEISFSGA